MENSLQLEAAALAQCECTPFDCGVLLTDFAWAYSSVTHSTSKGSPREYRSGSARRSGTRTFRNGQ